ncbi:MAG: phospho-N-acetylmuramoyl-pentapeptide-transferase [Hydrotalea sp.]|nr:phospho-N-acetylmuramoyl-pentapeptide-transferase [Hydrotalea sp.]
MFYYFLLPLDSYVGFLNVFRYISFRALMAMLTAFLFSLAFYPWFMRWLRAQQRGQTNIRADVPLNHLKKSGTPTMGGLMIIVATLFSLFCWGNGGDIILWGAVVVFIGFGLIGMVDDLQKVTKQTKKAGKMLANGGLPGWVRLLLGGGISVLGYFFIRYASEDTNLSTTLYFPFFKDLSINFGWGFLLVMAVVVVGSANAVNLTDGLDGLAIGPILIVTAVFGFISYLVGNSIYADYLQIHHVDDSGELAVLCAAIIGAGLGFLWFNAPPAMIFMGDTGSLALGGVMGYIAVATKHEIVLAIAGMLFVVEAMSVMLQVGYFKYSKMKYKAGRRIFLMAPLHHHYEKKGLAETHIVIRFWIVAGICALIALSTLKLR